MSSNNATLNTVIDQVEWIERAIGDFVVSIKDHVSKLTARGEKTFGSFEDRFTKGNENLNAITNPPMSLMGNANGLLDPTDGRGNIIIHRGILRAI
ncbi:hypothetical protein ACH3XW_10360 [Acanthocheilonema viteae]